MVARACQYGSCLEDVSDKGIVVSLKTATYDGEVRAIYCCAAHASAALGTLAVERGEDLAEMPNRWRVT